MIASSVLTFGSLYTQSYFSEYENLKSFRDKNKYMINHLLLIKRISEDTGTGEGTRLSYLVKGIILGDHSEIELRVTKLEYLKSKLDKQPLYKSKLTGDIFLRDAPLEYYNAQIRSFYFNIYLKISFYIILGLILYKGIGYAREKLFYARIIR
ncbi:hypothetical protein [Flavobacterium sp. HJSW_4]|uniref:hypothetical protein n=1 Tax=Flavobacterium sp. HJSW_4 TaxID=3344660 RepID=UPI0035F3005B